MKIRLGYWDKTFKQQLHYASNAHGILCGPARRGKFTCVVAPICLTWQGSLLILDPKAEAAMVSARYRRDVLGQDVAILNPFNIEQEKLSDLTHAQYCSISALDPASDNFAAEADSLADGWLPYTGNEKHWIDSARQLVSGAAMYLRSTGDTWSLPDLYSFICNPYLFRFCEDAINRDIDELIKMRLGRFAGDVARDNREIRGIVSTAITGIGFVANKPIAENMRRSTTDFAMKKKARTIYIILPTNFAMSHAAWMRTITNAWANACLADGPGAYPVLGILQEFATSVGNLNSIDTLNVMGAGHGCQIISELQDLNQLKTLKPNGWQSYLANAGFQIYMATGKGDLFSSEHISRMTGTVDTPTVSRSMGDGQQGVQLASGFIDGINRSLRGLAGGNGTQVSIGSRQKPYLMPEDIVEMQGDEMLVFAEGIRGVIRAGRRPYFEDPELAGRFDRNSYYAHKS